MARRQDRAAKFNKAEKPFMKRPMRDVLGDANPIFDEEANSGDMVNDTVDVFQFDEKFNEKLIAYNENIYNLDEDYLKLVPYKGILVRVMVSPLKRNKQGLLIPSEQMVMIPTKSGVSSIGALRNPWPFDRRAVIIAAPQYLSDINVGDTFILGEGVVQGRIIGAGDEGMVDLPFKFLHPDYVEGKIMPYDPEHKGYGYMLIPSELLQIKL